MIGSRVTCFTFSLVAILALACKESERTAATDEGLRPINGTQLFVKRIGHGEPMIVVHGGPVMEHGYLLPYLAPLADHHELIFYDQRLSGRSAAHADSGSIRVATFVEDIDALRRSLRLDRVHLLGHSWGGHLALRYALAHGDHLISLVLVSPMPPSTVLWAEEQRILAQRVTREDSIEGSAIRATPAFQERRPEAIRKLLLLSFRHEFHDPARVGELELYVPDDYGERSRQFAYMMPDLSGFDLLPDLRRITTPTLVIFGSDEPGLTRTGAVLHQRMPNAQLIPIRDAGHFSFLERPGPFLTAVRTFLAAHPRSRG